MDHAAVLHGGVGPDDRAELGRSSRALLGEGRGCASSFGTFLPSTCVVAVGRELDAEDHLDVLPVAALGRSSGSDCETMSFAVTMKMMRSTSVMSTSGVTLIPETIPSSSPWLPPAISSLLLACLRAAVLRACPCSARLGLRRGAASVATASIVGGRAASRPVGLEVGEQDAGSSASVLASVAGSRRWKKLFAATAGMATRRPTAVATSASAMFDMTACGRERLRGGLRDRGLGGLAERGERADDADDGAEEADERRVVAERAEVREAPLELHALQRDRAGHRLLGGLAAHSRLDDAGDDDGCLCARRRLEAPACAFEVAAAEKATEVAHQRGGVVTERPIEPRTFEHDGERHDAQHQHEDEDPAGPQSDHRALHSLDHSSSLVL